jgi:hypothetical protein
MCQIRDRRPPAPADASRVPAIHGRSSERD